MDNFILHERLKNDTIEVIDLKLCRVLLMNDSHFPWLILVPMRPGATEVHELSKEDRSILIEEACAASRAISSAFSSDKINIGALGNLVPQLHVHVVGRTRTDRAWPGPVWGSGPAVPYTTAQLEQTLTSLRSALSKEFA
ncbi:MAG: HIT domain-containing protein [Deltaproteobacteria bacterium]|nr:HIT domain-containing protein [Deltaproteobacteria bacterium]